MSLSLATKQKFKSTSYNQYVITNNIIAVGFIELTQSNDTRIKEST